MRNWLTSFASHSFASHSFASQGSRIFKFAAIAVSFLTLSASAVLAQPEQVSGEASLKLPDLRSVTFFGGWDGHFLLSIGILFCIFGLGFGLAIYSRLKSLPVHRAMLEIARVCRAVLHRICYR